MFENEISEAVRAITEKREEIFKRALDSFQIKTEQIQDRVKVYHGDNSVEHFHIDNKLAITFSPIEMGLDGKIKMTYKEHY